MTVADFYKKFKELMEQGYGEYTVSTYVQRLDEVQNG